MLVVKGDDRHFRARKPDISQPLRCQFLPFRRSRKPAKKTTFAAQSHFFIQKSSESVRKGDIIELGITAAHFGRTSLTMCCEVRNKITRKTILTIDKMVFVNVDENGLPVPHGKTRIKYIEEQFVGDDDNDPK